MKTKAYAKINLGLKVVSKYDDGYHELEMIMTKINLFDTLIFKDSSSISVICPEVNESDNLVYKIAKYLHDKYNVNKGIKIEIKKMIPLQAGLGGGSSDAATALVTLNKLWGLGLNQNDLINESKQFGSDIAFFISGNPSFVQGKGEILEDIKIKSKLYLLLIKPEFGCSTKEIYDNIDTYSAKGELKELIFSLEKGNINEVSNSLVNDLEKGLPKEKQIDINNIKKDLLAYGAAGSLMSGSGSCVFGVFNSKFERNKAYKGLRMFYDIAKVETKD